MPKFRITSPDGRTFEVNAPDGATQEQVLSYAQGQFGQATSPVPSADPTAGMSTLDKVRAGMGKAFVDLARGAGQRLGLVDQADIDEARRLDAPLMKTGAGVAGNIAGNAVPAAVAAFLPGGQTMAGSIATGAVLGALQPTATGESASRNALFGGAGGLAGYAGGKLIGYGANKLAERSANEALTNAARDGVASAAKDAGYVIPPTQTNPSLTNKLLEGLSGKISTAQSASIKNQPVTNKLAAEALGLTPGEPITKAALADVRTNAGQAYDALSNVGKIKTDQPFLQKIADLNKSNETLAKDFPELANSAVDKLTSSLGKGEFDSAAVVEALKRLRFDGGANKNSLDPASKALGRVQLQAADALEGLIDRQLAASGQGDLLNAFRNARQLIAKSYMVEKALNESTGNVIASKVAKELAKGKPLSGELRQIGEFGQTFPKAAQEITSSMPGISPLDFYGAGGLSIATSNPLAMLAIGARPVARTAILSKAYQNSLGVPKYNGNALLNALASDPSRVSLQVLGEMQRSPQLSQ